MVAAAVLVVDVIVVVVAVAVVVVGDGGGVTIYGGDVFGYWSVIENGGRNVPCIVMEAVTLSFRRASFSKWSRPFLYLHRHPVILLNMFIAIGTVLG